MRLRRIIGNGARRIARGARRRIEAGLKLGDQVLDRVDPVRKVGSPLPLGAERLFRDGLLFLPFVDQQRQPQLFVTKQIEIAGKPIALRHDVLAHIHQLRQIGCQRIRLRAHFRQNGAEDDGGAHGLKRVLGPYRERRRRLSADPLQGGENFHDDVAALVKRLAEQFFLLVERDEARSRGVDISLDAANACSRGDEVLIEFASVLTERLDLETQLGLALDGIALFRQGGIEVLIALLERVDFVGWGWLRRRQRRRIRPRGSVVRRRLCEGHRPCAQHCAKGQQQSQSRAEHKARIDAARALENHRLQG